MESKKDHQYKEIPMTDANNKAKVARRTKDKKSDSRNTLYKIIAIILLLIIIVLLVAVFIKIAKPKNIQLMIINTIKAIRKIHEPYKSIAFLLFLIAYQLSFIPT